MFRFQQQLTRQIILENQSKWYYPQVSKPEFTFTINKLFGCQLVIKVSAFAIIKFQMQLVFGQEKTSSILMTVHPRIVLFFVLALLIFQSFVQALLTLRARQEVNSIKQFLSKLHQNFGDGLHVFLK